MITNYSWILSKNHLPLVSAKKSALQEVMSYAQTRPSEKFSFYNHAFTAPPVDRMYFSGKPAQYGDALTEREKAVLVEAAKGKTSIAISEALGISESTVKTHIGNIYTKLGAQSRTEIINKAREAGLLPDEVDYTNSIFKFFGKNSKGIYWGKTKSDTTITLSKRESEVLDHLKDGLTNRQISRRLSVSEPTVKTHVQNIYEKLGVSNRTQAIVLISKEVLEDAPKESKNQLSDREKEVLMEAAKGKSVKEIGKALFITLSTVKTHIENIYTKLGAHSRIDMLNKARKAGLLPDEVDCTNSKFEFFGKNSMGIYWGKTKTGETLTLTKRESEILDHLKDGLTVATISCKLFLAESTVKTHVQNIYEKLGVHNRTQAVALIPQPAATNNDP